VQLCIVHLVRASLRYVNWKEARAVIADLKLIYRAANREEAERQLAAFEAAWDSKYRSVGQLWRRHWEQVVPFFSFPAEIRKIIYTTNAVESLNMTLRKVIKTRGSFPNEEAAMKLLYLALRNVAKQWHTVQGWPQALNRFAILWEDRFPQHAR
jgi:putative transposase